MEWVAPSWVPTSNVGMAKEGPKGIEMPRPALGQSPTSLAPADAGLNRTGPRATGARGPSEINDRQMMATVSAWGPFWPSVVVMRTR